MRPAHALPEELKRVVFVNVTFEFGSVRRILNVTAIFSFPLREVCRATKRIVKTGFCAVSFASEKCFKITIEVVHLLIEEI